MTAGATYSAVFRAELLRNRRRPAPYVMAAVFIGNATLWALAGPAASRGWSTGSDFYITRLFTGFSFMTLPLCTAILMGDPVLRDFSERIDPLVFSKPLRRAAYVLGKFSGSFAVLMCCQLTFAITLIVCNAWANGETTAVSRMVDYVRHFVFFVCITHLALAAFHFAVGTLTRSSKAVYVVAICGYPLYIGYQLQLATLPSRWRIALDPLLFNWSGEVARGQTAEWVTSLSLQYDGDMIVNRLVLLTVTVGLLSIACLLFNPVREHATSPRAMKMRRLARPEPIFDVQSLIPTAWRADIDVLVACITVETRLLVAERSLVVILPLAVITAVMGPLTYGVRRSAIEGVSAGYAFEVTRVLLLVVIGVTVFYVGEAMHRDKERRIASLIWATPARTPTLLLAKLAVVVGLSLSIIAITAGVTAGIQLWRTHELPELTPYMKAFFVIVAPTTCLAATAAAALNALLRDKYSAYIGAVGIVIILLYLYGQGYVSWAYNPALVGLWSAADLDRGADVWLRLGEHRVYVLALSVVLFGLVQRSRALRS
jgi:ABC-type transport system involved in multi-copper enzyme maturation permease subunit